MTSLSTASIVLIVFLGGSLMPVEWGSNRNQGQIIAGRLQPRSLISGSMNSLVPHSTKRGGKRYTFEGGGRWQAGVEGRATSVAQCEQNTRWRAVEAKLHRRSL